MQLTAVAAAAASASQSALSDETKTLLELSFYCALLFLVIYTVRTPWWHTVHGRTLAALSGVFVIVLLHAMLVFWGLLRFTETPDALDWVSASALLLAPLAFLTMTWQLMRKRVLRWWARLRWRRAAQSDPLSEGAPERLTDYPEHRRNHEKRS